jgi:hypothetical protein
MATQLYKMLGPGRKSCHGGSHTWEPGVWYSVEGDLIACEHGFHLCRARDLLEWLHVEIWHAEARGKRLDGGNKSVVRSARITTPTAWDDTTARLFAADCADRALAVAKVTDARCHAAVNAARLFAAGCIDDAAEAAAEATAGDARAARAAEKTWQTKRLVAYIEGRVDIERIIGAALAKASA